MCIYSIYTHISHISIYIYIYTPATHKTWKQFLQSGVNWICVVRKDLHIRTAIYTAAWIFLQHCLFKLRMLRCFLGIWSKHLRYDRPAKSLPGRLQPPHKRQHVRPSAQFANGLCTAFERLSNAVRYTRIWTYIWTGMEYGLKVAFL